MHPRRVIRGALALCRGRSLADVLPWIAPGERIPPQIHQIFFTSPPTRPPPEIQASIDAIRRMNPDYSYRLYDHTDMEQFIERQYGPRMLALYRRIDPLYGAARADLFRYLLLYRVGGVYLDVKSSMRRPLREVIRPDDRYLLSYWRNAAGEEFEGWGLDPELTLSPRGELQQWYIAASPGHPFLRAVIGQVLENIVCYSPVLDGTGWPGVLRTTGPTAYTLAILPELQRHSHRLVDSIEELGLQYSLYATAGSHQALFGRHYTDRSEPIVIAGRADRLLTQGLAALQGIRQRLRRP